MRRNEAVQSQGLVGHVARDEPSRCDARTEGRDLAIRQRARAAATNRRWPIGIVVRAEQRRDFAVYRTSAHELVRVAPFGRNHVKVASRRSLPARTATVYSRSDADRNRIRFYLVSLHHRVRFWGRL